MTETHTPTPWKVQPHDGWMANKIPPIEILGADGRVVACNTSYYPTPISEANAAFIVKAVNSHTALVTALTNARAMLTAFGGDPRRDIAEHGSAAGDEMQAALLDQIDAALAGEKDAPKDGMVLVPRELSIKQKVPGVSVYTKIAGECRPVALAAAWTAICDTFADAPKDDGWIEWKGGKCPVDDWALVETKYRNGCTFGSDAAVAWDWEHRNGDYDVIAYRVMRP